MINCPLCRNGMDAVVISGVEIDYCRRGCKGVWFDNYELVKLDEIHEGSGEDLKEILSAERVDDTRDQKLMCPKCEVPLKRRKYRAGSDVDIDNCYSCNGIYLDSGELALIRKNYEDIQSKSKEFLGEFEEKLAAKATKLPDDYRFRQNVGIISRLFGRY